jgi:hypothetical protein
MSETDSYTRERSKSRRLKLAHLPNKLPPHLRLGGFQPPKSMPAGEYKVQCEGASKKPWPRGWRIELKHRVIDGEFSGVGLNQWIPIDATGVVSPHSRYAKQCEIALGCPLAETSIDLNDPAAIFSGRFFKAFVGFRKTEKARGGMAHEDNALLRKDESDGLRVHELLAREEL